MKIEKPSKATKNTERKFNKQVVVVDFSGITMCKTDNHTDNA